MADDACADAVADGVDDESADAGATNDADIGSIDGVDQVSPSRRNKVPDGVPDELSVDLPHKRRVNAVSGHRHAFLGPFRRPVGAADGTTDDEGADGYDQAASARRDEVPIGVPDEVPNSHDEVSDFISDKLSDVFPNVKPLNPVAFRNEEPMSRRHAGRGWEALCGWRGGGQPRRS